MAERRMFAKTIIDSDAFLEMPLSTQTLYFHLSMRADDDGFINNPKKIQRMIGASDDDLKLLFAKRFVLGFDSGVIVIKHWKIHNYIRSDRFKETVYQEEKALLRVKENGAYSLDTNGIPVGIPNGYHLDTQDRIGKDSIDKNNNISVSSPKGQKRSKKEIVDDYTSDDDLRTRINDFIEMRNTVKKPMTTKALQMLLSKLDSMASTNQAKIEILEQSIMNSWQSVYPISQNNQKKKNIATEIIEHNYSDEYKGYDPRKNYNKERKDI